MVADGTPQGKLEQQLTSQRENVYKTFRMTPKASRQVFVWGFIAPVLVAGLAWSTDVSVVFYGLGSVRLDVDVHEFPCGLS